MTNVLTQFNKNISGPGYSVPKVKERPILFSGPMVIAILEGRKTQTRRIVKHQPISGDVYATKDDGVYGSQTGKSVVSYFACPYGQPGDRLWVRETHAFATIVEGQVDLIGYRATAGSAWEGTKWKPSIFMRRKHSRITLEITAVRLERLQEISLADVNAEGTPHTLDPCVRPVGSRRDQYQRLWESINGPQSWHLNPWVWVIEFMRIENNRSSVPPPASGGG